MTQDSTQLSRRERRRIAAIATDVYLQEHFITRPQATRRERRDAARVLRKRVLRESPPEVFAKVRHSPLVELPKIIVPEIDIQVEGMDTKQAEPPKGEVRTPSGRIILP